jgi:hypothetical protein
MPIGINTAIKDFDFLKVPFGKILKTNQIVKDNSKKILITQYHIVKTPDETYNKERQKEIDACLLYNLKNKLLDEVHLLTEEKYDLDFLPDNLKNKIFQTVIGERLTYKQAFDYYNKYMPGTICILCNADIFTDESIEVLNDINFENTVLALTRYEFNDEKKSALLRGMEQKSKSSKIYRDYSVTVWSQDCWIWKMEEINIKGSDFHLGIYGCDNRIAYFINESGYYLYNPCRLISVSHYDRIGTVLKDGDILKGVVSKKRDPAPEDHLLYRTFMINSSEVIDKYTIDSTIVNTITKNTSHGKEYFQNLLELKVKKNINKLIYSVNSSDEINCFEYEFSKVSTINIIDISGLKNSIDNYGISYVSEFEISYAIDYEWVKYPQKFKGIPRANGNFIKRNYLSLPIFCKKIRIHILNYVGKLFLETSFYGDTIKSSQRGQYNITYYDNMWQKPVITEYNIFRQIMDSGKLPFNYFAFPWATLIDETNQGRANIRHLLLDYLELQNYEYFTIVQHIYYKELFEIFCKLNIKYIFTSHFTEEDQILAYKYGLELYPFPLYAKCQLEKTFFVDIKDRKYLTSFIGNYNAWYLTDIREHILKEFSNKPDCYIIKRDEWHYHKYVYKYIEVLDKEKTEEYINVLKQSKFSLCPSGTGPNSIRLWESLSFGSIPVILADTYVLPKIKGVEWDKYVIRWEESKIGILYEYLKTVPESEIECKSRLCVELFNTYFADKCQIKIIEEQLKELKN